MAWKMCIMTFPLHITGSRRKSQAASMLFSFLVPFLVRFVVLLLVFHSFRLVYINLLFAALLFLFCPSTLSYKSFVLFLLFLLVLLIVLLSSFPFFIFCVILARYFLLPASFASFLPPPPLPSLSSFSFDSSPHQFLVTSLRRSHPSSKVQ